MSKYITFLFVIFTYLVSISVSAQQAEVFSFKRLQNRTTSPEASYIVENKETGNLAVFLEYSDYFDAYLMTKEFKMITYFGTENLPNRYDEMIGYTIAGDEIQLFMKANNDRKYGSLIFNFENKTAFIKRFDFKLKNEKFLQASNQGQNFYFFTQKDDASKLGVYQFNARGDFRERTLDLENETFLNGKSKKIKLYDVVNENSMNGWPTMAKINEALPNSLELTSELNKLYEHTDRVVMTIDGSRLATYILEISLPNLEYNVTEIKVPTVDGKTYKKSNSFLKDNVIFQFAANKNQMDFMITNWRTNEVIKSYTVKKDETIPFVNTLATIENGSPDNVKDIEGTDKFLRKVYRGDLGVSVLEEGEGYKLTIGSTQEVATGGGFGGIPMAGVGAMGSIGAATVSFNPVFFAYHSYTHSKSITIEGLLDKNFQPIGGKHTDNIFDLIHHYEEVIDEKKLAETVQSVGENYIFSYFNKKNKTYKGVLFKVN